MDDIRKKVDDEIEACLGNMRTISPDDEKYPDIMDNLSSLYKLRIEEKKLDIEREEREARREMDSQHYEAELISNEKMKQEQIDAESIQHREEMELRIQQIKVSKREVWINLVIAGVSIFVPLTVEVIMYIAGMKFEETGTITSKFFQMMLNSKLFKHKK